MDDGYPYWQKSEVIGPEKPHNHSGWIITSFILAFIIIVLIILFVLAGLNNQPTPLPPFSVQFNVDAPPLNLCGADRNSPCVFSFGSVSQAVAECNTLSNICQAFVFNDTLNVSNMKIVDPQNTFSSINNTLYVRNE